MELCCGSAALTLACLGATRPLLPYQGSKWRFRKGLFALLEAAGASGSPSHVHLSDPGPWGRVAPAVLDPTLRPQIMAQLATWNEADPRAIYDSLHRAPTAQDTVGFSAAFLFLQRLSYSGKAVGTRTSADAPPRWVSPGFNTSSAYGLPATDRFGQVKPMIPSLLRVLHSLDALAPAHITGTHGPAQPPEGPVPQRTIVYLDPPYVRSTAYPGGSLDRPEVVALAQAWHAAGATVIVSEGEAVHELVHAGWTAQVLDRGRQDSSPFRGKQVEWVTWSPASKPTF